MDCPIAAPDVIFGAEDEDFHPFHMLPSGEGASLPSNCLSDWNYKDPTRLLVLIQYLRFVSFSLCVYALLGRLDWVNCTNSGWFCVSGSTGISMCCIRGSVSKELTMNG